MVHQGAAIGAVIDGLADVVELLDLVANGRNRRDGPTPSGPDVHRRRGGGSAIATGTAGGTRWPTPFGWDSPADVVHQGAAIGAVIDVLADVVELVELLDLVANGRNRRDGPTPSGPDVHRRRGGGSAIATGTAGGTRWPTPFGWDSPADVVHQGAAIGAVIDVLADVVELVELLDLVANGRNRRDGPTPSGPDVHRRRGGGSAIATGTAGGTRWPTPFGWDSPADVVHQGAAIGAVIDVLADVVELVELLDLVANGRNRRDGPTPSGPDVHRRRGGGSAIATGTAGGTRWPTPFGWDSLAHVVHQGAAIGDAALCPAV